MSDPTQPNGTPSDEPVSEAADAPENDADQGDAGPGKARAYVDPTIAAEAELATREAEIADWKDKFVRAHAEMDNLRKRTEREKADTSKYAISKFAGDVLAVADNLQRALAAFAESGGEANSETKSLIEGVELTNDELSKALDRHGVRKIEALNAVFDPNMHQAVMQEENKDVDDGTVLKVFQEGYQIGDRVLRPSMVVVAKGGNKPAKDKVDAPAGPAANDDVPPEANGNSEPSDASGDEPNSD